MLTPKIYKLRLFFWECVREGKREAFSACRTMRLKPLSPVLREKKRYIAFEVVTERPVALAEVVGSIRNVMRGFLGDLTMARLGVLFLKDWKRNRGILRVATPYVDEVRATLALVQEVARQKAVVRSFMVSGTIDKIRRTYF